MRKCAEHQKEIHDCMKINEWQLQKDYAALLEQNKTLEEEIKKSHFSLSCTVIERDALQEKNKALEGELAVFRIDAFFWKERANEFKKERDRYKVALENILKHCETMMPEGTHFLGAYKIAQSALAPEKE